MLNTAANGLSMESLPAPALLALPAPVPAAAEAWAAAEAGAAAAAAGRARARRASGRALIRERCDHVSCGEKWRDHSTLG